MRIEIDKKYIVSLKTIEEYEEFSKITPWYDNLAGIPDWREYPDEGGFALRVENREIKGFDNLSNYNGYIDFRDYILITISDNSFNLVSSNSSKNLKPIVKSFDNPKVGDEVRITDKESVYSRYDTWAEKVKAKNWKLGFAPNNGSIGKITKLAEHTLESKTIALVDIDGTDVIISLKGLELITRPKSFDNPEVGDIYSNVNCKRTVLGVAGRVIFMSGRNQDNYTMAYIKEELIELGFTIEGKEVEEITMEELIKELGREVIIKK